MMAVDLIEEPSEFAFYELDSRFVRGRIAVARTTRSVPAILCIYGLKSE
jgi:hypothetical protein